MGELTFPKMGDAKLPITTFVFLIHMYVQMSYTNKTALRHAADAKTKGRRHSAADSKLFAKQMTQMARMDVAGP